jgi:hypothetical protein
LLSHQANEEPTDWFDEEDESKEEMEDEEVEDEGAAGNESAVDTDENAIGADEDEEGEDMNALADSDSEPVSPQKKLSPKAPSPNHPSQEFVKQKKALLASLPNVLTKADTNKESCSLLFIFFFSSQLMISSFHYRSREAQGSKATQNQTNQSQTTPSQTTPSQATPSQANTNTTKKENRTESLVREAPQPFHFFQRSRLTW